MKDRLSPMQQKIINFLIDRLSEGKGVPSIREIGAAVDLKSSSSVHAQLNSLERKGYIRRSPLKSRSIEVLGVQVNTTQAPLVGRVRAGSLALAQEEWIGFFPLPSFFHGKDCFILQVKGDSMIQAGIQPLDYVIVQRQDRAENGDLVVALVDDEATLKRFYREGERIILKAANPAYPDLSYKDVCILGKIVGLFRLL